MTNSAKLGKHRGFDSQCECEAFALINPEETDAYIKFQGLKIRVCLIGSARSCSDAEQVDAP
ncbi:hypothetical protein PGTUg99_030023 [Puccinia graminis f. sp. tritici]|uniref:Uncharacterized protein n=1 Tax=Puccinia graminis f. sp. tritici TaxID=56615 RepID=A0A5B0LWL7_PUCGR|nr:hypothetical protein PGTUg99_030023 [Puccinia graminis f. sp. tritici]